MTPILTALAPATTATNHTGAQVPPATPARLTGPRDTAIVALLTVAAILATAWARPLMLPDEGRYVGIAWEMMRSGDWLVPTLNGLPYFHKPPLFYWITAGSMSVFGLHEWAARAAPLAGAGLAALSIYAFARRWWNPRAAGLAWLALIAQPLFFLGGQFANLDMLVAGCITAAILLFADAALRIDGGLPYRAALAGAFAAAAAGVLAKGLIGAVIPALVIGTWLLVQRRWRTLARLVWWPGLFVFVLITAPWFIAMQMRFDGFLNYFFIVQHVKRFAGSGFNNVQPFWFFPAVLLVCSLPWLPWLRRVFAGGEHDDPPHQSVRLLAMIWAAAVLLFFSLPSSKLVGYVLPAVPPLALLIADGYLALGRPSVRDKRWWQAGLALGLAVSLGVVLALAVNPRDSSRDPARALAAQRGEDEPVVLLGNYYFDLPFYAHLRAPVSIVDDWNNSREIARHDNWRKELADAGRFAPDLAAARLIDSAALPQALCRSAVSWVIGPSPQATIEPLLIGAEVAYTQRGTTLWRVQRRLLPDAIAATCAGTPNAN
jgi:4-amino-4-deoxy-L-arabinose transferase-like glycosyltransferase